MGQTYPRGAGAKDLRGAARKRGRPMRRGGRGRRAEVTAPTRCDPELGTTTRAGAAPRESAARGIDSGVSMRHGAVLFFLLASAGRAPVQQPVRQPALEPAQQQAPARPTLVVRQSGEADLVGDDDLTIAAALERLRTSGGTLVLGPGRWVVRHTLFLPRDLELRGEEGAVLALPSPVKTAAAAPKGTRELVIDGAHEFRGETRIQILPPVGQDVFADGTTKSIELQQIASVEGAKLTLVEPLPFDLPAGCRVGYPHKLLWVHKEGHATITNLAFEGGRLALIPMPGHSQRCAIWASAPFGFEEARKGPPGQGVIVRNCRFSNWYGRGVALYNHEAGAVEDCRFERIGDEALDLDHFVERFHIANNQFSDVLWGIVLNDASRNVVEGNSLTGCEIGIWSWWYEQIPRPGINEENVIRGNTVKGVKKQAILIGKGCVRYVIQDNTVDGPIDVFESENTVGPNAQF